MKKTKKLGILCGVLVVVCGAAFAVSRYQEHKEAITTSEETILEIPTDTVTKLSWEKDGTTLSFHKEDDAWIYDDDETFPVDTVAIENLLTPFNAFQSAFKIEDVDDYSLYGLDDPTCTINFTADDTDYTIKVGDLSKMDSERYVTIADDNTAYLMQSDPMDQFDTELSALIKNDEIPNFDSVNKITFSGHADYTITHNEDDSLSWCSNDAYYTDDDQPLDTDNINSYISTIRYLGLTDYATYNADEEDLSAYGLDDPELTATIEYADEDEDGNAQDGTFTFSLGLNPDELAAAVKEGTWSEDGVQIEDASDDSTTDTTSTDTSDLTSDTTSDSSDSEESTDEVTAYLRIGDSNIIYKISDDTYEALYAAAYNDLRHKAVLTADFDDIDSIDITLDDKTYTLTSEGEEDDKKWAYNDTEVNLSDFETAFQSLAAESASDFTDEQPTEKEEISFTLHLNNENFPELKISLYRYDGDKCLAEINDEPVSLISRDAVVTLIEAVNKIVL